MRHDPSTFDRRGNGEQRPGQGLEALPASPHLAPPSHLRRSAAVRDWRTGLPERRLAGRAALRFGHASSAPVVEGAHEFRDNAVTLVAAGDAPPLVVGVGASLAASFGLGLGELESKPNSLGQVLGEAFAAAQATARVTPFEAAVATPFATCVMLRGVVLPTLSGGEAVLSWKQVLDDDASARLRAELLRELRPHVGPVVDAFA